MSNLDESTTNYSVEHTYMSYAMIFPINYSGADRRANPEFYEQVYSFALGQDRDGRP